MVEKQENSKRVGNIGSHLSSSGRPAKPLYVSWMQLTKATPSCCLVSGPPLASNYNNCKFSPLLALHMCNYGVCHSKVGLPIVKH